MSMFWISINGEPGTYIDAHDFGHAARIATFMNPTVTTLTIEDHTEEESCPTM